jgi:threonine/homoserine/homoserine lactone efflux protein
MFSYAAFGAAFGFSAAAQPGPFQAYLVSSAMSHGWKKTMPAVFAPILSDIPVVCLVLVALTRIPTSALAAVQLCGGVFLLYLSAGAVRAYRSYGNARPAGGLDAARTFVEAVAVNLLNPNPYISWSIVLGPLLLQGWRESPSHGIALVTAFYSTFVAATLALLGLLAGARSRGPRVGRALVGLSAFALAAFGCYQAWVGASRLAAIAGVL